jgi:lipopolysaccharide biosynthesis glycosyltransferase
VVEPFLDQHVMDKYNINADAIASLVEQYDIITTQLVDVSKASNDNSVRENWYNHPDVYEKKDLDEVEKILKTMYPDYVEDFENHLNSKMLCWYNCYIMKKELFFDYCEWLFPILFELEKRIDTTYYSRDKKRVFGLLTERLYGAFLLHAKRTSKAKIIEKQLVFIENAKKHIIPEPFAETNNIPILLISSNENVPILGVFITSVLNHASKDYNYDFVVLHKDISQDNQRLLNSIILKYTRSNGINSEIRFFTSRKRELINFSTEERFNELIYYRLFAPWILGSKYKKIIVMDTDIIVKTNIAELFNEDVSDYWAGCVIDIVYQGVLNKNENDDYRYTKNTLGLEEPYNYVNAGVKLLNLEKIRNELSEEEMDMLILGNKYRIDEQDVFNSVYAGKIKFVDLKWNYFIGSNWWVRDKFFYTPLKSIELYESCKNPAVLHWANVTKPWLDPEISFANEFWEAARNSPFYEILLNRMMRNQNQANVNSIRELHRKHDNLLASRSYRLGRNLTWFPRKVRGFSRCLKENGLGYTIKHFIRKCLRKVGVT